MSGFNGSGIWVISGTGLPYVTNTTISSTVGNTLNNDIATGLSNVICKDGQSTPTANIKFGGFKIIGLGNGTALTDAAAFGQLQASTIGAIGGLTLSTAGSSGTFGIASGGAVDSTNAFSLYLSAAFTKTTATWASGTGNGSLDTGSIANTTWYHVFLIGGTGQTVDILTSLSPTSPTLPSGYTVFRRIGSMKTDSSAHWVKFIQNGNQFLWAVPIADYSAVAAGATTAITLTLTVPTGIVVNALFNWVVQTENGGVNWVSALTQTDTVPASNTAFTQINPSAGNWLASALSIPTNTSAQIRVRLTGTTDVYYVNTQGWIDTRGQG